VQFWLIQIHLAVGGEFSACTGDLRMPREHSIGIDQRRTLQELLQLADIDSL
jgi:hypothetical protein